MSTAWTAAGCASSTKLVLLALADNANDAGVCWPAIPSIARRCSLDERTVYRAIATLEGLGHVTTESRPGRSTIYRVHPCQEVSPDKSPPLAQRHPTPDTKSPTPDRAPPPSSLREDLTIKNRQGNRQGRAGARARSRSVPEDFEVTPSMREWAREKCPNVDIDAETETFRDHEYRDPHSNWTAAWRTWMRRAPEFRRGGVNGHGSPTDEPRLTWRPPPDEDEANAGR